MVRPAADPQRRSAGSSALSLEELGEQMNRLDAVYRNRESSLDGSTVVPLSPSHVSAWLSSQSILQR